MRRPILALLAALALLVGLAGPSQSAPGEDRGTRWYLALGDSLGTGYQPDQGDDLTGGYAGGVRDSLLADGTKARLRNLSCSGETVVTMVHGGRCAYGQGNQLDAATQFLRAHAGKVELVTIDIGANDVQTCASGTSVDVACIEAGLRDVATLLPVILGELRAAAGPDTQLVVVDYYNPFLSAWLTGQAGQDLARLSSVLQDMLNGVIAREAAAVDADLAEVSEAFRSDDWTLTTLPGVGVVPTNVATICGLTWMCLRQDIHANDAGYAVMAETVAAVLD